jgi:peptidoglycan glycosyltransferase
VTTPTFDPNNLPDIAGDTTGAYEGVYLNRFLQSVYIPGSIFKIATTAAVLEGTEDILDMTFTCTGKYEFGVDRVTCERVHGEVDLKKAMQESCNCAFAQIALHLGAEKLDRYVRQFKLTERINFDGVTTAAGNFKVIGEADVNLAWSAIGQHLDQMNPCRFLTFVGAVANDGIMVEPHVVEQITSGEVVYKAESAEGQRILSHETAAILQEFMRNNVVNNYGADNFPGLTVCAKTGTGEVDGDKKSNAMFAGFLTDEEYPLAFIVAVEDAGYGKKICIPIISQVLASCKEVLDSQS